MNTHYFGHLKGFAAVALLVTSVVSCTKSDRTATPDVLTGSWKVTDVTIVNEEAGIHRTQKDLNGIGESGMQFAADRSYLINGSKNGTWMHDGDVLGLRSLSGETIQFKVSQSADGDVHLERDLPAAGGLSGATVYYSLVKE
jgi:hypothetical protein